MTDLFAACARLDPRCVADAIAPAVARGVDVDRAPLADGDDLVIEAGPWIPRTPARHLLPSLALLSDAPCGVRFELSARHGDAWSPWVATATLGDAAFTPQADAANGLRTEIDEVHAAPAVDAVRLRARIGGPGRHAALDAPWLLTLSASDGVLPARDAAADAAPLAVPPRTQMTEPDAVRLRVCSPTSVGMALEYLGCPVPTSTLAAEVFHPPSDRYGLWPAAVRAGAAHGMLRTPSDVLGLLFFWTIFVIFASLGIDALGVVGATAMLLGFLPAVFAAVLILLVGWLVANFLSQGLLIAAVNAGLPEARLLARAVHWGVLLFAIATALTQLGIGKEMVLVAFGITFGGLVFALALAFGLGGRNVARELLERRLRREGPPPQERLTHL